MSKRVPAETGRRIARGGPAGRGPTKATVRGTTARGRLMWPPRRIRPGSGPSGKSDGTGPGKGPLYPPIDD